MSETGDGGASSALLNFIRKNPPLRHLRRGLPAETPSLRGTGGGDPIEQAAAISRALRHAPSSEAYQQRMLLGSLRLKTSFLFRALGSAAGPVSRFSVCMLILLPAAIKLITIGLGISSLFTSYYLAMAFSTVGHLWFLPVASVALLEHGRKFESKFQRLIRLLSKPLVQLTVVIYARLFVSFLLTVGALLNVNLSFMSIVTAAIFGIALLIFEILREHHLIDWDGIVPRRRTSTLRIKRRSLCALFFAIANVVYLAWLLLKPAVKFESLQFASLLLLSPLPTLGLSIHLQNERHIPPFILLQCMALVFVWLAVWILSVTRSFQETRYSVTIGTHKDLLLAANGRSWIEQYSFLAHILSPLDDAPTHFPLTSVVTFIGSESYGSGLVDHHPGPARHACLVPTLPPNIVPVFTNEAFNPPSRVFPRQKLSLTSDLKNLPYTLFAATATPIINRCLAPETISAVMLVASQNAHRSFLSRAFCLAVDPSIFGGAAIWDLSDQEIQTFAGAKRRGFYSNEAKQVLSCEAGAIVFGDQINAALLSRAISLVKALQIFLTLTETLMTTVPTGIMKAAVSSPGPVPTLKHSKVQAVLYRFDNEFLIDLELGADLLYGGDIDCDIYRYLKSNSWRKFGDGSIGMETAHRDRLLRACQESLHANFGLFRILMRILLNLTRVRNQFFHATDGGDKDLNFPLSDAGSKLKKHYPTLCSNDQVKRVTSANADVLTSGSPEGVPTVRHVVSLVLPLQKILRSFSELPLDRPVCVPNQHLEKSAKNIADEIEEWTVAVDPGVTTAEPVIFSNLLKTRRKGKQIKPS
eukprot:Gregarina_sp_Poly_1__7642@NODE_429_length_8553_cov_130_002239_g350_i0_p1_GENE_NODE_429_length_8553_cov_130_002239_g350_i0NODE_429_length_8553_cov_130_002239_g350_i0_p1_ORF_typecomplete_len812_score112_64DUF5373/PF17343_2/0_29YIF1/PF03878_15/13_NODE_429_length_8553_cov_130_002239_g350_i025414976